MSCYLTTYCENRAGSTAPQKDPVVQGHQVMALGCGHQAGNSIGSFVVQDVKVQVSGSDRPQSGWSRRESDIRASTPVPGGSAALQLQTFYRVFIRTASILAIGIGVLVAAGWIFGIDSLVRPLSDFNAMKFNAALCLIASGCGLWLAAHATAKWHRWSARGLGAGVLLIGSLSLLEDAFGWNLHIDQPFWFALRWHQDLRRMVPEAATFYVFAGLFLIFSCTRRRQTAWAGSVAAILASLIAQEAVLHLIFRPDKVDGLGLQTAIAFAVLSVGVLVVPSQRGFFRSMYNVTAGGRMMRRLVPAATLSPLVTGWIYLELTRSGLLTPAAGIIAMVMLYSALVVAVTVVTANSSDNVDLRLAAIIDSSDDAVLSKSLDGIILTWNVGAEHLYGYSAAEAIGKPVSMLIAPERQHEHREFLDRVGRGERVDHHETIRMRKDGSRFDASVTISPIRNSRGEIIGCSAISRDVTQSKLAAKALNASEKAYRELAELVPQLIWKATPDGLIVYFNQRWVDYTGLTLEESCGRGWNTPFHPEEKQQAWDAWNHAVQTGEVYRIDCRLRAANGDYRWFLVKGVPLHDAEGNILEWFGTCTDIDDLKQAEAQILELNRDLEQRVAERTVQLQETERQVRRKLDNILSPQGDVTNLQLHDVLDVEAVQPLMEDLSQLIGIPVAMVDLDGNLVIGAGWQDICTKFHRAHPASCRNCLESDCQLTAGVPPGQFRLYKCKNNMWDMATPIMLGDRHIGNLLSGQFLFSDETADKALFIEQARKFNYDEAEYLAALDRVPRFSRASVTATMELYARLAGVLSGLGYGGVKLARAMAETTQANADLLQSSKELEGFAYSVSHDLRAPLRHLDGFLTLLAKRCYQTLDDQGKHYIDCTLGASQRMGQLIDDLLQFSRLGRREIHKSQIDLNAVIREIRRELEPESDGRRIVWQVEDLPPAEADPTMLRQVLENLIANALKFTRKREVAEISIGTMREQDGQRVFFVRDNGAGFDMHYYDKLFQVFQRLHGEDEFEGTGIGLANVRRIVERHGGRVWAEGEVDKGATFYFSVPQADISDGETNELFETSCAR